jgi:hypothetical protein
VKPKPKPLPLVCPNCGQRGDARPGMKLSEHATLTAVFVDEQPVPLPQQVTCMACGHCFSVARGSVEVRKP